VRYASVFAACAACFSLRAAFRVCHDFDSVFGFGFSLLRDSRVFGVAVDAMYTSQQLQMSAEWDELFFARRPPFHPRENHLKSVILKGVGMAHCLLASCSNKSAEPCTPAMIYACLLTDVAAVIHNPARCADWS